MFDQLSKIGKQIGGDLNKALHIPLKTDTWSIGSKAPTVKADATKLLTPASLVAEHDEEKEAVLQGLEANYYQQDFEPLFHELSSLPATFDTQTLEDTAEARTGVLEVCAQDRTGCRQAYTAAHEVFLPFRLSVSFYHDMCCSTTTNLWKASLKLVLLRTTFRYSNCPLKPILACCSMVLRSP